MIGGCGGRIRSARSHGRLDDEVQGEYRNGQGSVVQPEQPEEIIEGASWISNAPRAKQLFSELYERTKRSIGDREILEEFCRGTPPVGKRR